MAELNGAPVALEALQNLALINYGHFTSMRIEDSTVRGLSLHLDRLARDCRAYFDTDLDRDYVLGLIQHAIRSHPTGVVNLRVTVFDPALGMGHPGSDASPQFLITFRSGSPEALPPVRVKSAPYIRETPSVKHAGLCGTIRLRRAAQRAGFGDALFVGPYNRISEGATWNIGFIDGSRVVWPEAEVLEGVTMQLIKSAHPDFEVRPVTLDDVPNMAAAFATNVSIGVRPIASIDDTPLDVENPALAALSSAYLDISPDAL